MDAKEVVALIKSGFPDAEVFIDGQDCSFSVVVVSARFENESLLKKQQLVLATVKDQLASGVLHAMSVKAYTPREWREQRNLEQGELNILH